MIALAEWLFASYALLLGVGAALLKEGLTAWALLLLVVAPLVRIVLRFAGRGYYRIGYIGEIGEEDPEPSGWITRDRIEFGSRSVSAWNSQRCSV